MFRLWSPRYAFLLSLKAVCLRHQLAPTNQAAELFFGRLLVAAIGAVQVAHFLVFHRQPFELDDPEIERFAVVAVHFRVGFPDLSLYEFHAAIPLETCRQGNGNVCPQPGGLATRKK